MFIETQILLDSPQPIYGRNEQSHFAPPELEFICPSVSINISPLRSYGCHPAYCFGGLHE